MVGAGEVAVLTAAIFRLFIRLITTIVLSVAELVLRDAAIVLGTSPVACLARVIPTIFPCVAKPRHVLHSLEPSSKVK